MLQVHPTASHGGILFDSAFQRELLAHIEAAVHDRPRPPVRAFAPPTCELLSHPAVAPELKEAAWEAGGVSEELQAMSQQLQQATQQAGSSDCCPAAPPPVRTRAHLAGAAQQ